MPPSCVIVATLIVCLATDASGQAAKPPRVEPTLLVPLRGLDEFVPTPEDNPLRTDRIALGQRLFFDARLSRDGSTACASCHRPNHGFADTVPRSRGAGGRSGRRNAPSLVNRAYGSSFFWDGRAATLEEQVLQPIHDSLEMDLPVEQLVARLGEDARYRDGFAAAFADGVTPANVARALASYVRTLRSGDAPVDRSRDGDTTALSPAARRGLALFTGRANCSTCHLGPNFTDEQFHNTGVARETPDLGRFAVTDSAADRGAFKTPTLRDVARTAPYMHDGSLPTLEAVVDFYDRGGRPNPSLDPEIHPLALSPDDKRDLVSLLRALTGRVGAELEQGSGGEAGGRRPPRLMLVARVDDGAPGFGARPATAIRAAALEALGEYARPVALGFVALMTVIAAAAVRAITRSPSEREPRHRHPGPQADDARGHVASRGAIPSDLPAVRPSLATGAYAESSALGADEHRGARSGPLS